MTAAAASLVLAFALGAACRYWRVPAPAPSRLLGALLVVSLTLGYLGADALLG